MMDYTIWHGLLPWEMKMYFLKKKNGPEWQQAMNINLLYYNYYSLNQIPNSQRAARLVMLTVKQATS